MRDAKAVVAAAEAYHRLFANWIEAVDVDSQLNFCRLVYNINSQKYMTLWRAISITVSGNDDGIVFNIVAKFFCLIFLH